MLNDNEAQPAFCCGEKLLIVKERVMCYNLSDYETYVTAIIYMQRREYRSCTKFLNMKFLQTIFFSWM